MVITTKKISLFEKIRSGIRSMRFTMLATYLAIIVTTLVLMCVYIISLLSESLYSAETINMFAKANIISATVSDIWGSDTSATAADKFAGVIENSLAGTNIRGVVTNTSYTVLYDTNAESQLSGKVFMRDVLKRALDGEQAKTITTVENDMRLISVAVPIEIGGSIIGGVYLAESINTIDDTIQSTRTSLIVFSALIIILIGMLSLAMSYIITSPLEKFREVAREISKGDFTKRLAVKGHNEMAQMAETLNYMCDELELLEEKRRNFVSDASHELKTPMAGIKLICDSLVSAENLEPAMVKEFLTDMSDEVDRLTRIVERLLVLTRMDAGDTSLKAEETDIRMLINQVVKKLTPIATSKDIVIYTDYHDKEFDPILLDYDKMYEAIYNIADNAIKYSPEGGFVHIDVTSDSNYLTIKFEDNGPGIPESERDRIFERFYRLDDSRARDTGGTGLGLSITKEAVSMHGGTITVTNASEVGSIFTIRLPYKVRKGGRA
ncbi:MAG: cell wall metabolism sensor histidine kinase WalK [Clostridia bacterium]|nr:cell wall metabolism sensor histidine kinase WalK [Clostridia bacterium]MCI9086550.1 cell wall metabolism sensor histidine kinase WalK [Clostridia bacterium]NDO18136.1 cell wall metabolism sensor histidine kinase WalK [Lachnospiraceae bacterium MD329]